MSPGLQCIRTGSFADFGGQQCYYHCWGRDQRRGLGRCLSVSKLYDILAGRYRAYPAMRQCRRSRSSRPNPHHQHSSITQTPINPSHPQQLHTYIHIERGLAMSIEVFVRISICSRCVIERSCKQKCCFVKGLRGRVETWVAVMQ